MRSGTFLDADIVSLGRLAGTGWQWWVDEMEAMLPAALRAKPAIPPGERLLWDGALAQPNGTAPAAGRASILIDPALVLIRTIERPSLPRGDMQNLVALDLDRLTPFAQDAAYLDIAILGSGSAPATVRVQLTALPKAIARAVADACKTANIVPQAVGIADPAGTTLAANFIAPMRADGLVHSAGRTRILWWVVVLALFALDLGLYIYRDIASTQRLEALVDAQSAAAKGARRVAAGLQREELLRDSVMHDRRAGDALAVLSLISRVLPTGTWVERFAWDGTQLRISGYKPAQLNLLKTLRATGRFASVRTTVADVASESSNGEPFDMTATLASAR